MELKSSVNLVFMEPSSPHEMFILLGENIKILDALIFNPDLLSDANVSMQYFIVLTSEKQIVHGEQGVCMS